jgi:hypothetical protein
MLPIEPVFKAIAKRFSVNKPVNAKVPTAAKILETSPHKKVAYLAASSEQESHLHRVDGSSSSFSKLSACVAESDHRQAVMGSTTSEIVNTIQNTKLDLQSESDIESSRDG